jgi:hypothetical protein
MYKVKALCHTFLMLLDFLSATSAMVRSDEYAIHHDSDESCYMQRLSWEALAITDKQQQRKP